MNAFRLNAIGSTYQRDHVRSNLRNWIAQLLGLESMRFLMIKVGPTNTDIFRRGNWTSLHLEHLYIACDLDESTITGIVGAARHLKTFWATPRVPEITFSFVKTMADARERNSETETLHFVYSKRVKVEERPLHRGEDEFHPFAAFP